MTDYLCTASHTEKWDERVETNEGPIAECLTCHRTVALVPHFRNLDRMILVLHHPPKG